MTQYGVGILIFDDVEVLDFCGPFEVFSTTRLKEPRQRQDPSPFEVLLLAEKDGPVTTSGGMQVTPHTTLELCPALDILIVPGGWGTRELVTNQRVQDWLVEQAPRVSTLASVCTGSMVLAQAGLLKGLEATTHWRSLQRMQDNFADVKVVFDKHFVFGEKICTSAGISAGIDMSLKMVQHYIGESVARATARHMEYPFPDSDKRRITV
ncbi:DJ-1/PfpI family protein [Lacimicrobium alkaliphilum]|uniref:AraC family transcriptional regulator n=1 Tax=Lacimicrobium alkaliphilum TaxID=1526571 RepID=A0ABQ1RI55_9ALTE|nr:DJ-1/PfpI family protein [Lacimicrobium alkaliphilum]GGD71173.1 AraC family transcriptional regulator [Lacimicrobium alkaliphilum]